MIDGWQSLTTDDGVLSLSYSFGVGVANTMAVRLDDSSWLVVSPALNASESALDALAKSGQVSALIANNAFHHMGQPQWRKRFPQAKSYAPRDALSRLRKKASGVSWESLDALKLPSRIAPVFGDGSKAPDMLMRASTGAGTVWFTGDMLSNMAPGDLGLAPRLVFQLLGARMGYAFNPVPSFVYLKDRAAWKRSVLSELEKAPPCVVLPAHGAPIREQVMEQSRRALA